MLNSNLSALSMSALKALATDFNAVPTGDKRIKQSWIDAIELSHACETIVVDNTLIVDACVVPLTVSDTEIESFVSDKKSPIIVFGAFLILLILAIKAVFCVVALSVKVVVYLYRSIFGEYDIAYDPIGWLQEMVRERKLTVSCS